MPTVGLSSSAQPTALKQTSSRSWLKFNPSVPFFLSDPSPFVFISSINRKIDLSPFFREVKKHRHEAGA
jgi:hypothetical protein